MTFETLASFALFAAIMTGTPGPGNMLMVALGAHGGMRQVIPVLLATLFSAAVMNFLVGLGLGSLITENETLAMALKVTSMAYMLYLAWKLANMHLAAAGNGAGIGFREGLLIHPLSPKSWAMSIVGFTTYFTPTGSPIDEAIVFVLIFQVMHATAHLSWALLGQSLLQWVGHGQTLTRITRFLACLMVITTAYALFLS